MARLRLLPHLRLLPRRSDPARRRAGRLLPAVALALAAFATAPRAEPAPARLAAYPLGPGDVLRIDFLARPEYGRALTVEADGKVDVPLIGPVAVVGRSIAELRAEVPVLLSGAVLRERAGEGEQLIPVRPEEVMVSVARYRPVYLEGAVREPGAVDFETGMTVRQALALGRGIGVPTSRSATLDAASEGQLLERLGAVLAAKAVNAALLAGAAALDPAALAELPLPPERRAGLQARAEAVLAAELSQAALADAGGQMKLKSHEEAIFDALRQKDSLTRIAQTEAENLERLETLARRGAASDEAVLASKRAWLSALDRAAAAQADAAKAQEQRRATEQANGERGLRRRSELLRQLTAQEDDERALRDKLDYLLAPVAAAALAGAGAGAEERVADLAADLAAGIVIFRVTAAGAARLDAGFDTPLMPGDVVSVRGNARQ